MNNTIETTHIISIKLSRACAVIGAALFLVLVLSGCRYTATPVDLLQAPDIAKDKAGLVNAVDKSLSKFGKLMLPLREEGEGAIRLIDVDGDGIHEAVVSLYNDTYSPQLLVFKEQQGVWREWMTIEQPLASKMEWLHIADMNNDGVMELIVGWVGSFDVPNMLEIYSFQYDGGRTAEGRMALQPVQMFPYTYADVGVIDDKETPLLAVIAEHGDSAAGTNEFVLINYEMSLYEWRDGMMRLQTSVMLNNEVNGYDRLIVGRIAQEKYGVVLEASAGAHSMLTTMYEWNNGSLLLKYPQQGSMNDGFTISSVRNQDMNDDGIIELQYTVDPPGNFGLPYSEMIYINQWLQWDGYTRYYVVAEEYSSYKHGVVMKIPPEWRGNYTVRKAANEKYGLADFYYWNQDWVEWSEEHELSLLVSLHAVPQMEWEAVETGWRETGVRYRVLMRDSGNLYIAVFGDKESTGLTSDDLTKYSIMLQEDLLDGRIVARGD